MECNLGQNALLFFYLIYIMPSALGQRMVYILGGLERIWRECELKDVVCGQIQKGNGVVRRHGRDVRNFERTIVGETKMVNDSDPTIEKMGL